MSTVVILVVKHLSLPEGLNSLILDYIYETIKNCKKRYIDSISNSFSNKSQNGNSNDHIFYFWDRSINIQFQAFMCRKCGNYEADAQDRECFYHTTNKDARRGCLRVYNKNKNRFFCRC